MQPRVTAILVARTGAAYLERTLEGLARQSRRPDDIVTVDAGSSDGSADLLAASGPSQVVSIAGRANFGEAIARALHVAAPAASEDEWLWLLAHDNAPAPDALEKLLAAVEIAPSVVIAGPKLMQWDRPDMIAEFGESMTRFGASIPMVQNELDQAQHDVNTDVLAVAANGMLVRRSVWTALGGFDPGLPSIDAGLDFSIRARLAGYRVSLVPGAKVASDGPPEQFGKRTVSDGRRTRIARGAQLHRRLVYARGPLLLLLHWLSLVPLAIIRAAGQLLAKRPGAVGGEFTTALGTAFGASHIGVARRNLRRTRTLGWSAIAPLRLPWSEVRERRAQAREAALDPGSTAQAREARAGFIAHGGLWMVGVLAILGLIVFGRLIGSAITGGSLLPLGAHPSALWAQVGYGWRDLGLGFVGAADPFSYVLAVLGSLTFWSPSQSIVVLYLVSLPLAGVGAWFCARRISQRPWIPVVAGLLWAIAPPLLGSLQSGHLGAAIAHLTLPWLVLLAIRATRSWASAAGATLLFAVVTASAPSLAPALVLCWIVWLVSQPRSTHRLVGIPILAAALFAPLVVQQVARGNALALLADPGVATAGGTHSGWQLALGAAGNGLHGWDAVLAGSANPFILVAVLLAPIGFLALLALFVPGSRRAIPSLLVALLGYLTAVAVSHISVSHVGAATVSIWPGAALSLFWLGLIGGVVVALDALRQAAVPFAVVTGVAATALVLPLLGAAYLGTAAVSASAGRILPAFVTVEAATHPSIGTLVLTPAGQNGIAATVERGAGTTLEKQSTLASTTKGMSASDTRLATLAGNLASRSGYDAAGELTRQGIDFVLLTSTQDDSAVHQRIAEALDSNVLLVPVGKTDNGVLWRYQASGSVAATQHPGNLDTPIGVAILLGQGLIVLVTVLLGIPTARRRRRVSRGDTALAGPATTFDEDDDA